MAKTADSCVQLRWLFQRYSYIILINNNYNYIIIIDIILYNCFQDKTSGLPSTLFPSFIVKTTAIPFSNPFLLRLSTWKMNHIRISKYRIHIALDKLAYHTSILGCLGKQFQISRRGESARFHIFLLHH